MTTQKTFKRRVRTRSAKTGESYTAARAQLLRKADPPAPDPDAMELTGVSDEAMRKSTGRTIGEWLTILDGWGARERTHTEIARWLVSEHGVPSWWAQSVTVGYERARGMRAAHQNANGFAASISRTVNASADRISEAFTDTSLRARWLPDAPISLRTAKVGRSARFDWGDPVSRVVFGLVAKGDAKTQIALAHEKLPDAASVVRIKAMWRERLAVLKELLERA